MLRFRLQRLTASCKRFSTCSTLQANRAIIYTSNGSPASVLSALTFPSLPAPQPGTLNIKFLLAPINPADINVIEGVYPAKPTPKKLTDNAGPPVFVGGNEGLAEVTQVGEGVVGLKGGEWVVVSKQQNGTWCSAANVGVGDVIKMPRGASEVGAATLTVRLFDEYNVLYKHLPNVYAMHGNRLTLRQRIICCRISSI